MARRRKDRWIGLGFDAWRLSMDAGAVIGLRTLKIAAGGAVGQAEAQLMVAEKVKAGLALNTLAITGGLGSTPVAALSKTLAHYHRKVKANRRRLTKA